MSFYDNFNCHTKSCMSNLMHFKNQMVHVFFLHKKGAQKQSINDDESY